MLNLNDITPVEILSAALFIATAALLLLASSPSGRGYARHAAAASILTIVGANSFFMMSYAGERPYDYAPLGPIEVSRGGERGYFEYQEKEGEGGSDSSTGARQASLNGAAEPAELPSAQPGARALPGFRDCPDCPEMVTIRAGFYRMGAAPDDAAALDGERPARMIGFGHPFAIGRYEVTVGQLSAFVSTTGHAAPSCKGAVKQATDLRLPVTCVSSLEAAAYVAWLKTKTGLGFRLPTEAEWEYAARAGSAGPYLTGRQLTSADANVGRAGAGLVAVGSYAQNAFGLYDIHGNASEMVGGCWTASPSVLASDGSRPPAPFGCSSRVLRDGHAGESAAMARLSARRAIEPDARSPGIGFRVARDLR